MSGFLSVRFSSVAQSCPTRCDPMNRGTPGLPVHHQLLESTQTHVHQVGGAIQPPHPLYSPSLPALNLSQYQGLFKWVSSSHQMAKYWSFSFKSVLPMNIQDGFPIGLTILISLLSKGSQESSPTHSLKASIFWHSALFMIQLSHLYMTTGKTIALTIRTFVGKGIKNVFAF